MIRLERLRSTPPWEWPPEAKAEILEVLRDAQARDTELAMAAELAGNEVVIDDLLATELLELIKSGSRPEQARASAAIALGPVLETADTDGYDFPEEVPISERKFKALRDALRGLYLDAGVPKEVRRRVLEAAVRAPQDWQQAAVRAAWASDDAEWKLTAVFCMAYVNGFEREILEALRSKDPKIHYEAVVAAGGSAVEDAWDHVVALVGSRKTPKPLLIAAIEAVASIRPEEAGEVIDPLLDSDDEDIAGAAEEALMVAQGIVAGDDGGENDDEEGFEDDDDEESDEDDDGGGEKPLH
ncbi:MAG TPA: hypothetical protein VGK67_07750 [Myxococcales bacterium]|jgi:hypothetical protein